MRIRLNILSYYLFIATFLFSFNCYGQLDERWIIYGYYVNDEGDSLTARYRIEHNKQPWKILFAQFGRESIEFENVIISEDTNKISFTWPERAFNKVTLERVKVGEKPWDSIWEGASTNEQGAKRTISIGIKSNPDFGKSLLPGNIDLDIIDTAKKLLNKNTWIKNDDRICDDDIANNQFSLFCALYTASLKVTGEYLHRRPALRAVRDVVYEVGENRIENHTLMDYNNHPETTIDEIMLRLDEAKEILKKEIEKQ